MSKKTSSILSTIILNGIQRCLLVMSKQSLSFGLLLLLFAGSAGASNPAAFLELGAGARATALGGAFVALADDATATYWNPAGLTQLKRPFILVTDRIMTLDTNYANLIAVIPAGTLGALGINFTYYGVDDVSTFDETGSSTGTLTDKEGAATLSYAYDVSGISLGVNLKYIYQRLSHADIVARSGGFGVDISLLYRVTKRFKVGVILHDNLTISDLDNESDYSQKTPLNVIAGLNYQIGIGGSSALNFMLDFDQRRKLPLKLHAGSELLLFNFLALRVGLNDFYAESRGHLDYFDLLKSNLKPTFGIGVRPKIGESTPFSVDYAISVERLGFRSFVSLGYGL
jgi:hypothetical protein